MSCFHKPSKVFVAHKVEHHLALKFFNEPTSLPYHRPQPLVATAMTVATYLREIDDSIFMCWSEK